ncbi:MAG: hypothetical protein QW279_01125 [Candidatus Jordarchaeaceae archaeon]
MKTKLYAKDLLKKLVTEKELKILEAVWNEELDTVDKKIEYLIEKEE